MSDPCCNDPGCCDTLNIIEELVGWITKEYYKMMLHDALYKFNERKKMYGGRIPDYTILCRVLYYDLGLSSFSYFEDGKGNVKTAYIIKVYPGHRKDLFIVKALSELTGVPVRVEEKDGAYYIYPITPGNRGVTNG